MNICGGSFPTKKTNPTILVAYFLWVFVELMFCGNHVSVGQCEEYGEEIQLVVPF